MSEENAELLRRCRGCSSERRRSTGDTTGSSRRGKAGGAETRSPYANLADVSNGKGVRIRGYLDPEEALKAARLG